MVPLLLEPAVQWRADKERETAAGTADAAAVVTAALPVAAALEGTQETAVMALTVAGLFTFLLQDRAAVAGVAVITTAPVVAVAVAEWAC